MKTTVKITAIALLLFVAAAGVTNAQHGRMARAMVPGSGYNCMNLPDLTDAQVGKITALREAHQNEMDELRQSRIEAEDIYTRNEIAAKMLLKQNEHLKSIESLLTESQKESFNNNITSDRPGFRGQRMGPGQSRGYGRGAADYGRGFRGGQGRGFGPHCLRN